LYNNIVFEITEKKQNNNKIASNTHNGAISNNYFIADKIINLSKKEIIILNNIIKKLLYLHKHIFKNIFSIGWDIMFDCSNKYNLKAYVLEGNFHNHGYHLPDNNNKKNHTYVKQYHKYFSEFVKKNLTI
tara:strand:- start:465 stop:854 length:390 start_codon:yes stop_codon:yes gene_type:complete